MRSKKGRINAVGCTNILVLIKQVYSEAKAVLDDMQNRIIIADGRRTIFRHPLANGKPSFFESHARSSAVLVPKAMSELECINLRSATIDVNAHVSSQSISELVGAIKKSHTLCEIQLKCEVSSGDHDVLARFKSVLEPLMLCCIEQNININTEAYEDRDNESTGWWSSYENQRLFVGYINSFAIAHASHEALDQAKKTGEAGNEADSLPAFVLTPECRYCYAIFAIDQALQDHLTRLPKHKIPFTKKAYNSVHPRAPYGGDRHACVVCGVSYYSRATLDDHLEKTGHHRDRKRQGIVPRYKKDNWWFTAKLNR